MGRAFGRGHFVRPGDRVRRGAERQRRPLGGRTPPLFREAQELQQGQDLEEKRFGRRGGGDTGRRAGHRRPGTLRRLRILLSFRGRVRVPGRTCQQVLRAGLLRHYCGLPGPRQRHEGLMEQGGRYFHRRMDGRRERGALLFTEEHQDARAADQARRCGFLDDKDRAH